MIEKIKTFHNTIFDPEFIEKAIDMFIKVSKIDPLNPKFTLLYIEQGVDSTRHDSLEEFLADYRKGFIRFDIRIRANGYSLKIWFTRDYYECLTDVYISGAFIKKDNAMKHYLKLPDKLHRTSKQPTPLISEPSGIG